jgi:hypothetical protein
MGTKMSGLTRLTVLILFEQTDLLAVASVVQDAILVEFPSVIYNNM